MKKNNNFVQYHSLRQLDSRNNQIIQDKYIVTPNLIKRLGLSSELEGHNGCVNCLEWSSNGRILASASDDVQVILWDPFKNKKLTTIPTGHTGNIFSVKFLPNTENRTIITGAADQAVRVHDVECSDILRICTCHSNRVKRCVTDPILPNLFWSAGEDGVVIQHDLRSSHNCPAPEVKNDRNVLIDLCSFLGSKAEAKCLAMNPIKTDYLAVGANDPYVRIYDRRMIKIGNSSWQNIDGAVQYFVPGHLPSKFIEYKRKYRSLASTFITFSPDGKELLVNLGGEQIYLFPLVEHWQNEVCNLVVPDMKGCSNSHLASCSNGYSQNGFKNGTSNLSITNKDVAHLDIMRGMRRTRKPLEKVYLPSAVEDLKILANKAFEEKKYAKAVNLYNEGLSISPDSSVLLGNRSAALLKREWDGDAYAAFKDCQVALFLDPTHHKVLLRMTRCLLELGRSTEAAECFRIFKTRFPEQLKTDLCQSVEKEIQKIFPSSDFSDTQISTMLASLLKPPLASSSTTASVSGDTHIGPTLGRGAFLRRRLSAEEPPVAPGSFENLESDISDVDRPQEAISDVRSNSSDSNSSITTTSTQTSTKPGHKRPEYYDLEGKLRDKSIDFSHRFVGHCNTTTDIKEANFFGGYICAGSDDGSFFIWDRKTTNIVKIIKGDESIVNCLQPHPSTCMLATSGIESVIRLWTPLSEEEGIVNDRVVDDVNEAACANQKRMNSNPFEVILLNMGYRLSGNEDDGSDDDSAPPNDEPVTACNPS